MNAGNMVYLAEIEAIFSKSLERVSGPAPFAAGGTVQGHRMDGKGRCIFVVFTLRKRGSGHIDSADSALLHAQRKLNLLPKRNCRGCPATRQPSASSRPLISDSTICREWCLLGSSSNRRPRV